jgi:hypothetical protein
MPGNPPDITAATAAKWRTEMTKTHEQAINLVRFCYCDSKPERPELRRPFSAGDWTYAEKPAAPSKAATTLFEENAQRARYKPAPKFELPELCEWEEKLTCLQCEGSRRRHRCPDCKCTCPNCGGAGLVTIRKHHETTIGRACFNSKYVAWLQELPNLALAQPPHKHAPLAFRFEGGEGLLMPIQPRNTA